MAAAAAVAAAVLSLWASQPQLFSHMVLKNG